MSRKRVELVKGDRVWVPAKIKGKQWSGEVADVYPGGVTVIVDGVPGMPKAFLYSETRKQTLQDLPPAGGGEA